MKNWSNLVECTVYFIVKFDVLKPNWVQSYVTHCIVKNIS